MFATGPSRDRFARTTTTVATASPMIWRVRSVSFQIAHDRSTLRQMTAQLTVGNTTAALRRFRAARRNSRVRQLNSPVVAPTVRSCRDGAALHETAVAVETTQAVTNKKPP